MPGFRFKHLPLPAPIRTSQRYLRILATTLRAVHEHTGATGDELAQFLARGVLIVHLQALGIDVTTKSSTKAIEELLDGGTQGND